MVDERRDAHERLIRAIARGVMFLIDPEEAEPRSTEIARLYDAYQDAKQLVDA